MVKEYSRMKRMLLRELSQNARMPITELAKRLGCSRNTIVSNMEALEKEFGLRYTLEWNKVGLNLNYRQIWCIKFGKKPKLDELKRVLENDRAVQFAARTDGDFDLIINLLADSGDNYIKWSLKTVSALLPYVPTIRPSQIVMVHTGFMPIQTSMIEALDLGFLGLDALDKRILTMLNDDCRMGYNTIAQRLGEDVETIRYRMKRILGKNIIERFTVIVERPPERYKMAFFVNYELAPGLIERYRKARQYYFDASENLPIINPFQYLSLVSGSFLLFGLGSFENEETAIRDVVVAHKEIYEEDNPSIYYAEVTDVLKGYFPMRSIDLKSTYKSIDWESVGKDGAGAH